MKIAVYGDSFADCFGNNCHFSWYNILQTFITNITVTSFGKGATPTYYSYKKFLETHHDYDKIIFLVSQSDRYTKPVQFEKIIGPRYIANIVTLEHMYNTYDLTNNDKRFLDHLKSWMIVNDDEYNHDMVELMLSRMEYLRNDIIYFPCFNNSMTQERLQKCKLTNNDNMQYILNYQLSLLKLPLRNLAGQNDSLISCHLTEEFNMFFAQVMAKKITTDVWDLSGLNNITQLRYSPSDYYRNI